MISRVLSRTAKTQVRLSSSASPARVSIHRNTFPCKSDKPTRPPLVILHGLLGSSSNFRTVAVSDKLNGEADVVTVDLRNHGRSGHDDDSSLPTLANDILRVIDDVAGEGGHVDLVGHSLGGKVAMGVALTEPNRVRKLVVADIAPVTYDTGTKSWTEVASIVQAVAQADPSQLAHRSEGDDMLASVGIAAPYRPFILQNLVPDRERGQGFRWRCNVPVLQRHLREFATFPFAKPKGSTMEEGSVTFLRGEHSGYVVEERDGASIRQFFPGAKIVTIAGAGHWVHADRPTEFTQLVWEALEA